MLVLSRKIRESVVVGGGPSLHPVFKVTVLEIRGKKVKLGFQADPSVPVQRLEVCELMLTESRDKVAQELAPVPLAIERGLSNDNAEAALLRTSKVFQGVSRVARRTSVNRHSPIPDTRFEPN